MKSCLRLGTVGLCLVASVLSIWWPTGISPAYAQTNLIVNPGFEGGFQVQGSSEISVGNGWTAWWIQGDVSQTGDGFLVRPEYKGEDSTVFGSLRVHSGRYSQKFFSTYSTHDAGLFQAVAVPAGATVRFSVWVQVWSSSEDDPETIVGPGNYFVSVGIDPGGATDPTSSAVVWSQPALAENRWVELAVTVQAQAGQVTVFLRGAPQYRVKHNDSYWDDARLVSLGESPPVPPPASQPPPETPSDIESYVVQPGDTLMNIALRYGTTIQALMALNDLQNANFIWVGQRLLIRGAPEQTTPLPSPGTGRYTVRPGDTLASIARRFGTTVAILVSLNNLTNPERIYAGQSLVLPSESGQTPPADEGQGADGPVYHVVQPGETLLSIAARYGVSIWSIAQANDLADVNLIWAGLRLVIPS